MAEQKNKIGPVWVIAEQMDCRLLSVSTQLTGQARKLADELNTPVEAILLSGSRLFGPGAGIGILSSGDLH